MRRNEYREINMGPFIIVTPGPGGKKRQREFERRFERLSLPNVARLAARFATSPLAQRTVDQEGCWARFFQHQDCFPLWVQWDGKSLEIGYQDTINGDCVWDCWARFGVIGKRPKPERVQSMGDDRPLFGPHAEPSWEFGAWSLLEGLDQALALRHIGDIEATLDKADKGARPSALIALARGEISRARGWTHIDTVPQRIDGRTYSPRRLPWHIAAKRSVPWLDGDATLVLDVGYGHWRAELLAPDGRNRKPWTGDCAGSLDDYLRSFERRAFERQLREEERTEPNDRR